MPIGIPKSKIPAGYHFKSPRRSHSGKANIYTEEIHGNIYMTWDCKGRDVSEENDKVRTNSNLIKNPKLARLIGMIKIFLSDKIVFAALSPIFFTNVMEIYLSIWGLEDKARMVENYKNVIYVLLLSGRNTDILIRKRNLKNESIQLSKLFIFFFLFCIH